MPLIGYAEAWTPSTAGELVLPAVFTNGKTADQLAQLPIAGAAALISPIVTNFIDQIGYSRLSSMARALERHKRHARRLRRLPLCQGDRKGRGYHQSERGNAWHGLRSGPIRRPHTEQYAACHRSRCRTLQHPGPLFTTGHSGKAAGECADEVLRHATGIPTTVIADIPGIGNGAEGPDCHGRRSNLTSGTQAPEPLITTGAAAVMEAFRTIKASGLQPKRIVRGLRYGAAKRKGC